MNIIEFNSFYRSIEKVFEQGIKNNEVFSHRVNFARNTFLAHFIGSKTNQFYLPALTHLLEIGTANQDFEVLVMEEKSTGLSLPPPTWKWSTVHPHGEIHKDDNLVLTYEHWYGILRIFNRNEKKAYIWIQSIDKLPQWMRSFPLRHIVGWYFENSSIQPVHSGGISLNKNGIMLTGKGGSGKSSTCLSCLNHSQLNYLGDDFMLVDCEGGKEAFSLYNVAKVEFDNLRKFDFLLPYKGQFKTDDEKYQIFVNEILPSKIVNEFEIEAIFLPRISNYETGKLVKADPSDALMALAPSTMSLLRGNSEVIFNKLSSFVKKLPSFFLDLSSNFERNPEIIYKFLKQ